MDHPRRRPRNASAAALGRAFLLAGALLGAGCHGAGDAPRLLVLGIDGMDPQILSRLMDAGRMPNHKALAASGGFVPLATTMPPQSPVAWSSFITGLEPVGHGIFDFIHRDAATLLPYLSTSRKGAGGEMELLRRGRPFWDYLVENDIPATIFKVPANFPPASPHTGAWSELYSCSCFRAFAGMGTPDILGTYGTFTYFTEGDYEVPAHMDEGGKVLRPGGELRIAGGRVVSLRLKDGWSALDIRGPKTEDGKSRQAPFDLYVDADNDAAQIVMAQQRVVLRPGEWSRWLRVDYGREDYGLTHLTGIVRFYLKAVTPHTQLYMTPVNLDPANPAMPVSVPADEAARLQEAMGPYYTQGMPDDTKALEAAVLDYDEFLAQDELALEERRRQLTHELDRFEDGLLFFYVHSVDQVCHMLWRATDPSHPGYQDEFARHSGAIEREYEAMDDLLGEAMAAIGDDGEIVVLSDHGFAPYERSFNLNTWLQREGYLKVKEGVDPEGVTILNKRAILWDQTVAYGLGLNALYLNLRGRENPGAVDPDDRDATLAEITRKLLAVTDPANGRTVVEKTYVVDASGTPVEGASPDVLIGYARGYRSSGAAALGKIEAQMVQDNLSAWSGDHCMAAHTVPGVLLSSVPLGDGIQPHLRDIPGSILEYYGIEPPSAMMGGTSIWQSMKRE